MAERTGRAARITRLRRRIVLAAASVPLSVAMLAAPAGVAAAPAPLAQTGNVLPGLGHATRLGAVPSTDTMRVLVALSRPDPSGEAAAYRAMYDPASPLYHHFLTPAQFASRFGVPAAETQELSGWLRSGGLDVFYTAPTGDIVEASGGAATVGALFHTTISRYSYRGVQFIANDQRPSVPANLPVISVVGLNTLEHFTTSLAHSSAVPGASTPCNVPGNIIGLGPAICVGDYTPQDMWKLYDMPSSDEGQGQTMGIFMEGITDSVIADLRVFEARMGLPRVPVTVVPAPQPNQAWTPTDNTGEFEWDLDSDASTGAAPLADRLYYYDANSLYDPDVEAEFATWANDANGPLQMNASFGECETIPANAITGNPAVDPPGVYGLPYGEGLGDNLEPVAEGTLEQASMEGRTLFSSAGDTGGSCPGLIVPIIGAGNGVANQGDPYQNYPCASRYVVCVGGTVLYANDDSNGVPQSRYSEISWTNTGGGNSGFISEPAFQQTYLPPGGPTLAPLALCATDYAGNPYATGTYCRGAPDIAALSGDSATNGYYTDFDMLPASSGGTSLSSPLSMGMWTRIQAAAPLLNSQPAGLGFADETIYRVGAAQYGYTTGLPAADVNGAFFDVTTGSNGQKTAQTGWDETSGMGVFDVAKFIANPLADGNANAAPTDAQTQAPVANQPVGCPLFTTYQGNATDVIAQDQNDSTLDIVQGQLSTSADGKDLIASLYGPGLAPGSDAQSPAGGTGGTDYFLFWTTLDTSGTPTTWYARAHVSPDGGTITYSDGSVSFVTFNDLNTTLQGSFNNGVLTITVPLADVGNPAPGTELLYPQGATWAENNQALVPFTIDTGGSQHDFVVGNQCASPLPSALPEAPLTPLLAVAALGGLLGAGWIRRRRSMRATPAV